MFKVKMERSHRKSMSSRENLMTIVGQNCSATMFRGVIPEFKSGLN